MCTPFTYGTRCTISVVRDPADGAYAALTRFERSEYEALPTAVRRRDWLAGRYAAKRSVAARIPGLNLQDIRLVPTRGAPPVCTIWGGRGGWRAAPLSLSIAHRDGYAVAAAAISESRVGVDIERCAAVAVAHERHFVAPRERRIAAAIGATALWTLKEAAWKALALGDTFAFNDLAICARPDGRVTGVVVRDAWHPASATLWRIGTRHIAAGVTITQVLQ